MRSKKALQVILWVLAACLTASFLLFLSVGIQDIYWYSSPNPSYDHSYYEYLLEEDDYIQLIYTTKKQETASDDATPQYDEFSALAEYYKAASLYKAYIATEDFESAIMQLNIMKQNKDKIVEYQAYIERIHQLLQIDVTYPDIYFPY